MCHLSWSHEPWSWLSTPPGKMTEVCVLVCCCRVMSQHIQHLQRWVILTKRLRHLRQLIWEPVQPNNPEPFVLDAHACPQRQQSPPWCFSLQRCLDQVRHHVFEQSRFRSLIWWWTSPFSFDFVFKWKCWNLLVHPWIIFRTKQK